MTVLKTLQSTAIIFVALTLVTGVAYPVVVTLAAQALFPHQANGSLVRTEADGADGGGQAIGSELVGQPFSGARYFWPRPSATGPTAYNAAASTGSNYGPTNPVLLDAVKARVDVLRPAGDGERPLVPIDLVTASGSGLDPHITPAAAEYQAERVARARGLGADAVRRLIAEHAEGRTFGVLGEPRVNVLQLNLALDELAEQPAE
jgi:K+-transporting ATPase ATPase C chain